MSIGAARFRNPGIAGVCVLFAAALEASVEADYSRALRMSATGDHAAAIQLLEQITEQDPAFSRGWTALAELHSRLGRVADLEARLARSANRGACLGQLELLRLAKAAEPAIEKTGRECAARLPESFAPYERWFRLATPARRVALATEFSTANDPVRLFAAGFALAPDRQAIRYWERIPTAGLSANNANILDSELYLAYPGADPGKKASAERLLARAKASGDAEWAYRATGRLGEIARNEARFAEALSLLKEALTRARELGRTSATFERMAGECLFRLGRVEEAIEAFRQSASSAEEEKNSLALAASLGWLGDQHNELGQHTAAVAFALRSLEMAKAAGATELIADQHINLAFAWLALGHGPRALDSLREAENAIKPPAQPWHARILADAGNLYHQSGRPELALAAINRSLAAASPDPLRRTESQLLRAEVLTALLRGADAARDLDAAAPVANGVPGYHARLQLTRGRIALDRSRYPDAAAAFRQALDAAAGFPALAVRAHAGLSDVHWRQGRFAEALVEREAAIAAVERVRAQLVTQHRAGFLAGRIRLYRECSELLLRLNRVEDAFAMAERGRARALLDLKEDHGAPATAGSGELERMRAAMASVRAARDVSARRRADLDLQAATDRYLMSIGNSEKAAEPMPAARIRSLLDPGAAVLHYSLGDAASSLFVVTRDRVQHFALGPRAKLEAEVRRALAQLREPPDLLRQDEIFQRLRGLHQSLLGPALRAIAPARELIVVPDGALHAFPFEALISSEAGGDPGRTPFLVRRHLVRYAPSATLAGTGAGPTGPPSLLAYGDPLAAGQNAVRGEAFGRLQFTRQEVQQIAAFYPASARHVALGTDAAESALKRDPMLGTSSVLHLAVHGFVDDRWPGMSGLVLPERPGSSTEDGVLRIYEILALRLQARLVVLSACESGAGAEITGEGVSSLRYAFLAAGARSIVASLWRVNDRAAAEMMAAFHRQWVRDPGRTAEALRSAQLGMLNNATWAHPYYWAVFTLMSRGE